MSIITLGEILIDFVPQQKGLSLKNVKGFDKRFGGAPANVSIGLGKLENNVSFVGQVGNDSFGEFLIDKLKENKVNTKYIKKTKENPTTLAFVSLEEDGERDFIFYRHPGADTLLSPDDITIDLFKNKNILHTGSVSLSSEPSASATIKSIKMANKKGLLNSFDVNFRHFLWSDSNLAKNKVLSLLKYIDLLKVNIEELELLTNQNLANYDSKEKIFSLAKSLLEKGPGMILITDGKIGSYYITPNYKGFVKTKIVKAVDATGAGDAFTATFLHFLNQELNKVNSIKDIEQDFFIKSLRFANKAGSLVVTKRGAISALPEKKELFE